MASHYTPGKPFEWSQRFRGFLPVVVDVETGGFDANRDALLEIAAVLIDIDDRGQLVPGDAYSTHVIPFEGANIDPKSLAVNGIDPFHPLRAARDEQKALDYIFNPIRQAVKAHGCNRAVLVGHNAFFDLGFVNAAVERTAHKRNPFHPFTSFDTATLGGFVYGQTVLARALKEAGIEFDGNEAHSALYDTRKTAELFCMMVNRWETLNN